MRRTFRGKRLSIPAIQSASTAKRRTAIRRIGFTAVGSVQFRTGQIAEILEIVGSFVEDTMLMSATEAKRLLIDLNLSLLFYKQTIS